LTYDTCVAYSTAHVWNQAGYEPEATVDLDRLRSLLAAVQSGQTDLEAALAAVREMPPADLGYATVDHGRALRQGAPEVIFGQGKAPEHIAGIARELVRAGQNVLVTRLDSAQAAHLCAELPETHYVPLARVATIEVAPIVRLPGKPVALVSAGTSDLPVAEECAESLRAFGVPHERLFDVGVAGLHRLLRRRDVLDRAAVAIVVAGMEGALPSVIGGLVPIPVIAVPTSVGYGAGAGGVAALMGMLTSCASGITVCNIDNGFGAAFAALRMYQSASRFGLDGERAA
jgi:pyridinium-3,5-biscarboxylic acid mononucleotide synthase